MNISTIGKGISLILGIWLMFPTLTSAQSSSSPHTINVKLEIFFNDGEKAVEERVEEILAMEDFWAKYEEYQLVDMSAEQVLFRIQVEEISPLKVLSGYSTVSP